MSRVLFDHREPPKAPDLPALEFELGDTFEAVARIGREYLEAQRQQQNEREQRNQG